MDYPKTRRCDAADIYHGTSVPDPYRWLEEDSPETKAWVAAQQKLSSEFLSKLPGRAQVGERLKDLWNYEIRSAPIRRGGAWFFTANTGLQNQSVLYTMKRLGSAPRVLLDPNGLSPDGDVALKHWSVSPNGSMLAYFLSRSGSDWEEARVRNIISGEDLADHLIGVKYSNSSWHRDGFFYSRYDLPENTASCHKLCYHRLGSAQADDEVVFCKDNSGWYLGCEVTDDLNYLIIFASLGVTQTNQILCMDLREKGGIKVLLDNNAKYQFVHNKGSKFWFLTDRNADKGRIVSLDIAYAAPELREVIPEDPQQTLESASMVGNKFVCVYLEDAYNTVKIFNSQGRHARKIELPLSFCSVWGFARNGERSITFFSCASFTVPASVFSFDPRNGQSNLFFSPKVDFEPERYTTDQVFVPSEDRTLIPMFISYRKGLERNGSNPAVATAYGSHGVVYKPTFSPSAFALMELGIIYCVVNVRGGGEYGRPWREAAAKTNKPTSFTDFIAAIKYLIGSKYTCSQRLAIEGISSGGMLVAAWMQREPSLFGAVIIRVGTMDMLRFVNFPAGRGWIGYYGNPANREEFESLYGYSPLHNVRDFVYPPVILLTGDHDDRVPPSHSFKFAATMQRIGGPNPIIVRITHNSGHGLGKPLGGILAEDADAITFTLNALALPVPSALDEL